MHKQVTIAEKGKGQRIPRAPFCITGRMGEPIDNEGNKTDSGEFEWLGGKEFSSWIMSQSQYDALCNESSPAREFRLYDDDGNHCASGFIVTKPDDIGSELDFIPLDAYGEGAFGATEIRYRNKEGEFETL
jgi:hypothetical protein